MLIGGAEALSQHYNYVGERSERTTLLPDELLETNVPSYQQVRGAVMGSPVSTVVAD